MISEELEKETCKWLEKIENEIKGLHSNDEKIRNEITNIKAYMSDSRHFLEKKGYIRAFEAVIYAWAIFDTLARMRLIGSGRFKD